MKNLLKNRTLLTAATLACAMAFTGCAAKKNAGITDQGISMQYQSEQGKDLRYENAFSFQQDMEIREQKISISSEGNSVFHMKPVSINDESLTYSVTLESMSSSIQSPQGELKANTDGVVGKSFSFKVSSSGKELDYSEAEQLSYDYAMGQSKTLASDIQAFFPDLPDRPVKVGDSWESKDLITEKSSAGKMEMDITNYNTFEKLESYLGYDCMKITYTFKGSMKGEGRESGMELTTEGELSGTGTWYFAYKEGIYVYQSIEGYGTTSTQIKGPQEMTLPATRKYTLVTELKP